MNQKPIVFVIFDGLGDRPIKELNWKTPLEAANTPNLNKLAELGNTGLLHTIGRGIRPGSDVAHLSLFGYKPTKYYTGRGPFECSGYGVELEKDDIAFRGNVATLDENFVIVDRRAGRPDSVEVFAELIDGMEIDGVKIIAKPGLNHRLAIMLRGEDLSDKISDVDPHLEGKPIKTCVALDDESESKFTAEVVNKLIKKANVLFAAHPINKARKEHGLPLINCLLLRGAGKTPDLESFEIKYKLQASCIAGAGLYKGIARLLGMEVVEVKGATGKFNTNVEAKIDTTIELLKTQDFIFLHIKAPDSLAEDGKALEKRDFMEKADPAFKKLIPLVENREIVLSITGDHTTASDLKMHTADSVPLIIAGFGVRTDVVKEFGERSCQGGGLGHLQGNFLMDMLMDLSGRSVLYGN